MKVIIQIPCYNEETTLPQTIRDLPREITGVDKVEIMVVDDGSVDNTVSLAKDLGVEHIVQLGSNRGLAIAFRRGTEYALSHGADIVVNTDGDNQYCGEDIGKLVAPIVQGDADLVVGCRPIVDHPEFNVAKKVLQLIGSWALRKLSKTDVRDAASGFRAFSRETLQRTFIHSKFSYCMETLIQAGNSGIRVHSVDIRINAKTRESRLFKSIPQYIKKSGGTMLAMFVLYRPGRFFTSCAMPFLVSSLFIGLRFFYLVYFTTIYDAGRTYIPSLILLAVCAVTGVLLLALGVIGELMKFQRRITEESLYIMRLEKNK